MCLCLCCDVEDGPFLLCRGASLKASSQTFATTDGSPCKQFTRCRDSQRNHRVAFVCCPGGECRGKLVKKVFAELMKGPCYDGKVHIMCTFHSLKTLHDAMDFKHVCQLS